MTPEMWLERVKTIQQKDNMDYTNYYNGYSLLLKRGLNDIIPEIYLCAGNRTAGKTFFFKRFFTLLFKEYGCKFLWISRKVTQVDGSVKSFYEDIQECEDIGYDWKIQKYVRNVRALCYKSQEIGYFTFINFSADLKELSNMFNNVDIIIKDEFQHQHNEYMPDEVNKIRGIHDSVARGFKTSTRYCPLFLIGNQISIINPYYARFGIHKRLQRDTHFLRGTGWVLEVFFNKTSSDMRKASAFDQAFGNDEFSQSSNENIFMDNISFIKKMDTSKMRPQFSVGYENSWYSVWHAGSFYYVSTQKINRGPKYALDEKSHNSGTYLMRGSHPIIQDLKKYFDYGKFWFENIEAKTAVIELFIKSM